MFRPFGVPRPFSGIFSGIPPASTIVDEAPLVPKSVKRDIKAVVKAARSRNKKYIVIVNEYFAKRSSDADLRRWLEAEEQSLIEMAVI